MAAGVAGRGRGADFAVINTQIASYLTPGSVTWLFMPTG
jgi:peptidoglycan biosynthesis protein MviN/MurJ (putative lipid II flippase)